MNRALSAVVFLLLWASLQASDNHSWNKEQLQIIAAMERLFETTAIGGAGADEYGTLLAEDFGRWTVGSSLINDRDAWVEGVREWFDDGWRVEDRQAQVLEIIIQGDYAFTRRIVDETYISSELERSSSSAALAEVWIRHDDRWLLQLVNVHPLERP